MNILLDTNILFHLSRAYGVELLTKFINPDNQTIYLSIVSIAEIKSIAIQNNWGTKKRQAIFAALENINIVEINENLANTYAEIDAFSQCRNPSYTKYGFSTPRNMGKNDLWIASTAALLGLKLVTTDTDFNHLDDVFFEIKLLDPENLRR